MKRFVVSFLFDPALSKVVLIRKNRPDWMAGKLNAVGGHVEDGESPLTAAVREFAEETGLRREARDWHHFLTLRRPGGDEGRELICFWGVSPRISKVKSMTDEQVGIYDVQSLLTRTDVLKDTLWILVMAKEAASRFPDFHVLFTTICENSEAEWQTLK